FFSTQKCNIIQIETNRALYMDEDKRVLHCQQVEQLRPIMTEVVGKLVCWKGSHE
ncbi:MAG: hypothetical protein HN623_00190, partial [Bdellovibrionales bacterium]|nr:hypothetical protein [Bdellovibrionales bacterium]